MKKRMIGFALILCMLLSFAPAAAFAEEPEAVSEEPMLLVIDEILPTEEAEEEPAAEEAEEAAAPAEAESEQITVEPAIETVTNTANNGSCGANVYYDMDSAGNMRIYGSGAMTSGPLGDPVTLTIEQGVTSVSENALMGCTRLTTATIAGSVTSIAANAFSGCTSLKTIRFQGAAPSINATAFKNVVATVYYPGSQSGWGSVAGQNYGGTLSWQSESSPSGNTGWKQIDGKWYYYDTNGVMVKNAWAKGSDGRWYYLGSDGAMLSSQWVKDNGNWYYVESDGAMAESKIINWNGKQYYVDANGVMAVNTTITYGGQTYQADANGVLTPVGPAVKDGWVQSGGKWYFYQNGSMVTSAWVKASNKWYYLGSDGAMVTNSIITTNGKQY